MWYKGDDDVRVIQLKNNASEFFYVVEVVSRNNHNKFQLIVEFVFTVDLRSREYWIFQHAN